MSENVHRRHLTVQQRAAIAADWLIWLMEQIDMR